MINFPPVIGPEIGTPEYPIMFGSRAWCGSTKDSDWDLVLDDDYSLIIREWLDKNHIDAEWKCYDENVLYNTSSVKYTNEDGDTINILFYPKEDISKIKGLCAFMLSLKFSGMKKALEDKAVRCCLVESYLNSVFG